MGVRSRQIPPQAAQQMIELQNIRANDELFINEGIEEEQLQAAFESHDIKNDEEFKGKVTKLQADFN
jgi:hypothetical protein